MLRIVAPHGHGCRDGDRPGASSWAMARNTPGHLSRLLTFACANTMARPARHCRDEPASSSRRKRFHMNPRRLTVYIRAHCHLCEQMLDALTPWCQAHALELELLDVDEDPVLAAIPARSRAKSRASPSQP